MKTILNEDMKTKTFRPVYCLYGEETFLKRSYRNQLKEAIVGDDTMNLTVFDGSEVTVQQIMDTADTMPFFAERRLIIVDDSGLFKKDAGPLADYLARMPETTHLLFVESAVDKRNRLFKRVDAVGGAVDLGRQEEAELKRWVAGLLKREGKRIDERAVQVLLSMTGEDMDQIRTELDKLIGYTGEREFVTAEDVREICTQQITGKIFDMIAAVAARRQSQALKMYYDLLALKEPPMRILILISRHFNQLLQVKELAEKGTDNGTIAKMAGVPAFAVKRLKGQAGAFSAEELRRCVERCVQSEEDVKTGRLPDVLAAELLIVEFSGAGQSGGATL